MAIHSCHVVSLSIANVSLRRQRPVAPLAAGPHPSSLDEEAPCGCHPGCRTNWSLLMLKETLSASDVVGEVFRKANDVCEVIEWGEQVLMVAHSALSVQNPIGIPQSL